MLELSEAYRVRQETLMIETSKTQHSKNVPGCGEPNGCAPSKSIQRHRFNTMSEPKKKKKKLVSRLNVPICLSPYFHLLLSSKTSTFVEPTICFPHVCIPVTSHCRRKKLYRRTAQVHLQFTMTPGGGHSAPSSHSSTFSRKLSIPLSDTTISCFPLHVPSY